MVKPSELINAWKCICVVLCRSLIINGKHGCQLWYNSSFHSALGCSPFKALCGHEPSWGTLFPVQQQNPSPAIDFLQNRDEQLTLLKKHLATAQNRMKT